MNPKETKQEIMNAYNKELTEWTKTEEHNYNCIGFSEGTGCCIDEKLDDSLYCGKGRDKLNELLSLALDRMMEVSVNAMVGEEKETMDFSRPLTSGGGYPKKENMGYNLRIQEEQTKRDNLLNK